MKNKTVSYSNYQTFVSLRRAFKIDIPSRVFVAFLVEIFHAWMQYFPGSDHPSYKQFIPKSQRWSLSWNVQKPRFLFVFSLHSGYNLKIFRLRRLSSIFFWDSTLKFNLWPDHHPTTPSYSQFRLKLQTQSKRDGSNDHIFLKPYGRRLMKAVLSDILVAYLWEVV